MAKVSSLKVHFNIRHPRPARSSKQPSLRSIQSIPFPITFSLYKAHLTPFLYVQPKFLKSRRERERERDLETETVYLGNYGDKEGFVVEEGEQGVVFMEVMCVSMETAASSNDNHGHPRFQDTICGGGCCACLHTLLLLPLLWLPLLTSH